MSRTKKIVFIVICIIVFVLLLRFELLEPVMDILTDPDTQPSQLPTAAVSTDQPSTDSASFQPVLPDRDYNAFNLFKDGYQRVNYEQGIDGDTAIFRFNGKSYKTRFLAIDTPEVDPALREVEPWGAAASTFTKDKLKNADEIILELDPKSDVFDKFDRLLVWVWVDGELLNYTIVAEGLAEVAYLYGDYRYTAYLFDAQTIAQENAKKIWGETDPDFHN